MVYLQMSLALLNGPASAGRVQARTRKDAYGRTPFQDEALQGIDNVSHYTRDQYLDEKRLARMATQYGLADVIRWKPRQARLHLILYRNGHLANVRD